MGKRGPAKTPTAILKKRGSPLAKGRPDAESELPVVKLDKFPTRFNKKKHAQSYWKENKDWMAKMGLLTRPDHLGFEELCIAYARMRKAEDKFDRMEKEGDATKAHYDIARQTWIDYIKMLKEFGCTPAARGGMAIKIEEPGDNTGKDKYFGKKFGIVRA